MQRLNRRIWPVKNKKPPSHSENDGFLSIWGLRETNIWGKQKKTAFAIYANAKKIAKTDCLKYAYH